MEADSEPAADMTEEETNDFLATLGDMPRMSNEDAGRLLDKNPSAHVVGTLPPLPDDDRGEGKAQLHRIPAHTDGEPRHSETWAVTVRYPDARETREFGVFDSEAEARAWHDERLNERSRDSSG